MAELPAPEVARAYSRLWDQLSHDALRVRAEREAHGLDHLPANNEPWRVLAEQRNAARLILLAAEGGQVAFSAGVGPKSLAAAVLQNPYDFSVEVARAVMAASTYLWTDEIRQLAQAAPLPKHSISADILPTQHLFFSWQNALISGGLESNWLMVLGPRRPGVDIAIIRDEIDVARGQIWIHLSYLRSGMVWPIEFSEDQAAATGQILQLLAFLNSPYVTSARQQLPRPIRRELERSGQSSGDLHVNVVELRREVRERVAKPDESATDYDWQHHWWVSGHYRAQWLPSQKAHQVRWIAPYVKGPLDKPLLDHRVYVVDR